MMINKRLIGTVSTSKKYIKANVLLQWCSLGANIIMMFSITRLFEKLYFQTAAIKDVAVTGILSLFCISVRFLCIKGAARMGYLSSKEVKRTIREMIYQKLLRLGASYHEKVKTSEVLQVAVEGVEHLEMYFGAYLPQFFYVMLAPLTLFAVLGFVNLPSAVVLLLCVPLIPISIALVQTWAKKLFSKYWGQYTALGDTFLENLQGLTTLKIYQADEYKQEEMNREAEKFRKITMRVLTMQLNSITIMDLVAYGGAALGIIISVLQYSAGKVSLSGSLLIILLSADFFVPMRQLGSFFHVAMNGMAASEKIFLLLDLPEGEPANEAYELKEEGILCSGLGYAYEEGQAVLKGIDLSLLKGSFTALVGESGCGKSTIASVLMGRNKGYTGSVTVGGKELSRISEESLMEHVTYISHKSHIFKGTVRENLLMGKPDAAEEELWAVLEQTRLADFLKGENGLETRLAEGASNFSGGQRQRLALARAILHDSQVYIFDEATSNIDVESENDIMEQIFTLAKTKTVLLISHRLANVARAERIYVLEKGHVTESGTHGELLANRGMYEKLWNAQQTLENYGMEGQKA